MAQYKTDVKVKWENEWNDIKSNLLVPGDIIEVPTNVKMPCDAVITSGSSIVNEAMLTGESCPIQKTQLTYSET